MTSNESKIGSHLSTGMNEPVSAEQLVRSNAAWMLRLARRMTNDEAMAEDITQDALLSALAGLSGFSGKSTLKTWLHRITVNAALRKLHEKKRLAEVPMDYLLPVFDQYDCRIELPWTKLASTQEIIENDETRVQVEQGLKALSDAYRIIILLRDVDGYSTSEAAALLHTSEANIKVRLHRARAALKKLLEPILRIEESL